MAVEIDSAQVESEDRGSAATIQDFRCRHLVPLYDSTIFDNW